MKTTSVLCALVVISSGQLSAQDTARKDDWKSSAANMAGQEYPKINSERRAQFKIKAPDAKDVAVSIGKPLTVTKGDDGVWTITTSPLDVGFHFYRVLIDGANVADPATEIFRGGGGGGLSSAVEVPTGEDFYELKDVPHGEVASARISRTSPNPGGASSSIRHRTTTRMRPCAIPFSISNTAAAKMSAAGRCRVASARSWTTSSPRRRRSPCSSSWSGAPR